MAEGARPRLARNALQGRLAISATPWHSRGRLGPGRALWAGASRTSRREPGSWSPWGRGRRPSTLWPRAAPHIEKLEPFRAALRFSLSEPSRCGLDHRVPGFDRLPAPFSN